jgi:hypothetical protein
VLGLGVDADVAVQLPGEPLDEVDDLLERRHLVAAVVDRVALAHERQALLRAQGLQLGEREVVGEPAGLGDAVDGLGRLAAGELGMVGDVRRVGDVRLVAGDEDVVLRRDQVGLDVVGAHASAELVGGERVLGAVAGGAAVADDEHAVAGVRVLEAVVAVAMSEGRAGEGAGDEQDAEGAGDQQPGAGTGSGRGRTQYARRSYVVKELCPTPRRTVNRWR